MDTNLKLEFTEKEIVFVLKQIELMLESLNYIGDYYIGKDERAFEKELARFISAWWVMRRLVKIRTILSKDFGKTLGDDDMEYLERAMSNLTVWEKPDDMPDDVDKF